VLPKMQQLTCKMHGGTFMREVKRGRVPIDCPLNNPCTEAAPDAWGLAIPTRRMPMAQHADSADGDDLDRMSAGELRAYARRIGASSITRLENVKELRMALRKYLANRRRVDPPVSRVEKAASEIKNRRMGTVAPVFSAPVEPATPVKPLKPVAKAQTYMPPSADKAKAAKAQLEAVGWAVKGRAWTSDGAGYAEITASRGDELIHMVWLDGVLHSQSYSLWDQEKPVANNKPPSKLGFDPDETSDIDVVRQLSGMRVTWWNKLGQIKESAIIPGDKIEIVHLYTGLGDETPGSRVIKFCDREAGGFRAFRLDALLKVG